VKITTRLPRGLRARKILGNYIEFTLKNVRSNKQKNPNTLKQIRVASYNSIQRAEELNVKHRKKNEAGSPLKQFANNWVNRIGSRGPSMYDSSAFWSPFREQGLDSMDMGRFETLGLSILDYRSFIPKADIKYIGCRSRAALHNSQPRPSRRVHSQKTQT